MSLCAMEPAFNGLRGTQLLHTCALQARPHICERMLTIPRKHCVLLSILPPPPSNPRFFNTFPLAPTLIVGGPNGKAEPSPFPPLHPPSLMLSQRKGASCGGCDECVSGDRSTGGMRAWHDVHQHLKLLPLRMIALCLSFASDRAIRRRCHDLRPEFSVQGSAWRAITTPRPPGAQEHLPHARYPYEKRLCIRSRWGIDSS